MEIARYIPPFFVILLAMTSIQCQTKAQPPRHANWEAFKDYWYSGEAEITTFTLQQVRYGEVHAGEAVQIFVTEDFSRTKQVKIDQPKANPNDAVSVLKLNATRQFNTGIYQYNMMQSLFTPITPDERPIPLKVTTSSQDWCGQTWVQMNLKGSRYQVEQRSYFESQGDQNYRVDRTLMEDAIWTLIRIGPENLPQGQMEILPSQFYLRFTNSPPQAHDATGVLREEAEHFVYTVEYTDINRRLSIRFEKTFPFGIKGWTESYRSGFGDSAEVLETVATRKAQVRTDYWNHNAPADTVMRQTLHLKR